MKWEEGRLFFFSSLYIKKDNIKIWLHLPCILSLHRNLN